MQEVFVMKPKTAEKSASTHPKRHNESTRERMLEAAFTSFCEHGFSDVSTLEIATRARVSRDLYALFRNKQAVSADCIKDAFSGCAAHWMRAIRRQRTARHWRRRWSK